MLNNKNKIMKTKIKRIISQFFQSKANWRMKNNQMYNSKKIKL